MNNIKQELEKIKIPKELNNRVALGVKQAKIEQKKRYPNWMIGSVASLIIIGAGITFGGTYIADAAESFINQLFGSKENLMETYPDEDIEKLDYVEYSLSIAEEHLTEEEFNSYTQLLKELVEIKSKVEKENRSPNEEEAKRSHQIGREISFYEDKFTLIVAQHYASFPFEKPKYIPEGYSLVDEEGHIYNIGEESVFSLDYSNGENNFFTTQMKINQKMTPGLEYVWSGFAKSESYSLSGYEIEFVFGNSEEINKTGMRITVPEQGYKMILIADILSKEEMEKILLSMLE
ncbi:DUF4367 domain-containing protein [Bacillus sp. SM2101]|uniref:DUF4367 domain-containing protein n=1 Tax=Bacillus sp. SM2101 TaxID=2805366 RepID=UPI001BDE7462